MSEFVNPAKQERGRETQQRILRACKKLLKKQTFDTISLRQLVSHAKTSTGSFYARFRDKNALLPVLYEEYDQRLQKQLDQLELDIDSAESLDEAVSMTVGHFVAILGEIPNLKRALFEFVTREPDSPALRKLAKRRAKQYAFLETGLLRFRSEIPHPKPERVVKLGIYFVIVVCRNHMFYTYPQTRLLKISKRELNAELVNMLSGYLRNEVKPAIPGVDSSMMFVG